MKKAFLFQLFLLVGFINPVAANLIQTEECKIHSKQSEELPSWYYKVTVSINTSEGIKSGSAIWHEYWQKDIDSPVGIMKKFAREAIPVAIDESQTVFAILKSSHNSSRLPFVAVRELPCKVPNNVTSHLEIDHYIQDYIGYKQSVHPINYPDIVRFKDKNDPESIEVIYANNKKRSEKPFDRFAEIYGDGVFLKEITVEIVDQPVDWKLHNYLPWVEPLSVSDPRFFRQGFMK